MKVCILSMQRINNMGSLLQSYALKTTVEKFGHRVGLLDSIRRTGSLYEVEAWSQEMDLLL